MSKISLNIDFTEVVKRIEIEMRPFKPSEWAEKVGVSRNIVSNIHGSTRQKPSLEYIVAVSRIAKKPIEYFLWGEAMENNENEKKVERLTNRKFEILNEVEEWLDEEVRKNPRRESWFEIQMVDNFESFKKWKRKRDEAINSRDNFPSSKVA